MNKQCMLSSGLSSRLRNCLVPAQPRKLSLCCTQPPKSISAILPGPSRCTDQNKTLWPLRSSIILYKSIRGQLDSIKTPDMISWLIAGWRNLTCQCPYFSTKLQSRGLMISRPGSSRTQRKFRVMWNWNSAEWCVELVQWLTLLPHWRSKKKTAVPEHHITAFP